MLPNCYPVTFEAQRSLLAHHTGGVVIARSNPAVPTIFFSLPKPIKELIYSFSSLDARHIDIKVSKFALANPVFR